MPAVILGSLLAAGRPVASEQAAPSGPDVPGPSLGCSFLDELKVDYLNDGVPPPRGLHLYSGTLEPGQSAEFQVYGTRSYAEDAYYDLTAEFVPGALDYPGYHPRPGRVRVRPPRRGHDVSGTIRFRVESDRYVIVYTPRRQSRRDRMALFIFDIRCGPYGDTLHGYFDLTIKGSDSP